MGSTNRSVRSIRDGRHSRLVVVAVVTCRSVAHAQCIHDALRTCARGIIVAYRTRETDLTAIAFQLVTLAIHPIQRGETMTNLSKLSAADLTEGSNPQHQVLPITGFVRQWQVLRHIPISKSTLWRRVQDKTFPQPIKLSERVTVWRVEQIRDWIAAQLPVGDAASPGFGDIQATKGDACTTASRSRR